TRPIRFMGTSFSEQSGPPGRCSPALAAPSTLGSAWTFRQLMPRPTALDFTESRIRLPRCMSSHLRERGRLPRAGTPHWSTRRSHGTLVAMRYYLLATDYDGTLASDGRLLDETRDALERLRASARKIVMVTGRQLDDLQRVCSDLSPFEIVVAENGAVLYWPATNEKRVLAEAPSPEFVKRLRELGVSGPAVGDVIVATWHPHETS